MPEPPVPDAFPDDAAALDDRLHALAAGELDGEAARALEARLASDPALARRHGRILALERALGAEAPLALPAGLERRITHALKPPAPAWGVAALLRAAAAVLAAFGAWFLATGALPTPAHAAPVPVLERALATTRALLRAPDLASLEAAAPTAHLPPDLALAAGLALLALGLFVARRVLAPAPRRTTS